MNWLQLVNPFNYLASRIFIWFWLVLLTAVVVTLLISNSLLQQTEIRRLPSHVIQQIQSNIHSIKPDDDIPAILQKLQTMTGENWLIVNTGSSEIFNKQLLPRNFDQNFLTELSLLNRPRMLRHRNTFLAGPFILNRGDTQLALYRQVNPPQREWWRLGTLPEHVLLIFMLLISAIASFILAISISRPLRELLSKNLQFAEGKLDSRVSSLAKRNDELGQLGRSFNTMAERIGDLLNNQQRLLRDISHELRSPLARAQLALGLSERQQTQEHFPRLKQELERLDSMLDELLTYSRLDAGQYHLQKQEFDLTDLISEILEVNQVEADVRQQKLVLTSTAVVWINADSKLLGRAIENVLRNAIKYSPEQSEIYCTVEQQDKQIHIKICDQGPGLPESQLDAIFTPFYRVSDSRNNQTGGTGLGLAIVAQVMRQHSGYATASLRQPTGLCIELILPSH